MSNCNSPLTEAERTQYRSVVGHTTVADICYVNKIIRNVKSTKNCIKFPHLDLKALQLKLFTDASFNNLLHGGSQGAQIIFLNDGNNNLCPLY